MYKIFWPKFSICDLICHVYILFELVYNILQNKIQIWTFDSNSRIDLLWEFNYVLGFFIWTAYLILNSNSFTNSFQHLAPQKIVLCLRCYNVSYYVTMCTKVLGELTVLNVIHSWVHSHYNTLNIQSKVAVTMRGIHSEWSLMEPISTLIAHS
jgi:hypothetical protein